MSALETKQRILDAMVKVTWVRAAWVASKIDMDEGTVRRYLNQLAASKQVIRRARNNRHWWYGLAAKHKVDTVQKVHCGNNLQCLGETSCICICSGCKPGYMP